MNTYSSRRSIRLNNYDYAQEGAYFITICTHEKSCVFGHITNGTMYPNDYGQMVYAEWFKSTEHRPYIELGAFIIMPNHIHGIVIIRRGVSHTPINNETNVSHTPINNASNIPISNAHTPINNETAILQSPSHTIGAMVRGFKSAATKQMREMGFNGNVWQRNYYEHIIRDSVAYQNITNYILTNPQRWRGL